MGALALIGYRFSIRERPPVPLRCSYQKDLFANGEAIVDLPHRFSDRTPPGRPEQALCPTSSRTNIVRKMEVINQAAGAAIVAALAVPLSNKTVGINALRRSLSCKGPALRVCTQNNVIDFKDVSGKVTT